MKIYTLKFIIALSSISLVIGFSQNVDAAIFKCVNDKGETYYNDQACPISDKETKLKNIKDPEGGYIPPEFTEGEKVKGSKGVVVGSQAKDNTNDRNLEDPSDSQDLNGNSNSGGSSSAENLNPDGSGENVVHSSQPQNGKRTIRKNSQKKSLPIIPLKKERITKEHRSKILSSN